MQISQFPFLSGPGILHQPQSGSRQQVNSELQVKAQAQRPAQRSVQTQGGSAAARPANPAAPPAPGTSPLDQAVRDLAADGRLPRRGSLIDLKI
jgi:hypothetical protein